METDLIIIGSGPGGYRAAAYAATHGLSVVIAEKGELGGTCLNEGCIPTKTYARNAEIMETMRSAGIYGLEELSYSFDFTKVVDRKDTVLNQLRSGIEMLLTNPCITLVRGNAGFTGCYENNGRMLYSVTVDGHEYSSSNVIIATGSSPKSLRLDTCSESMVCDSSWLLQTRELPHRLCIVGAGVIGMEFASVFNGFGCEVTVVEYLRECLPALDSDVAKRLRKVLEKRGVTFYMQSAVKSVSDGKVVFERKGKETAVETDKVLLAVGRCPNVSGLNLETVGVDYDAKGIHVNGDSFMTNRPGIYAIGDVNGRQMLAHAATMQGIRAVNNILSVSCGSEDERCGMPDDICFDIMPAAIFTNPEAACVGPSEDVLKENRKDFKVLKANYRANGKALAMNETEGMIKLFTDAEGFIIGCHAFGAHASDMVQEVSALICRRTKVTQLKDIIHIHPTLGEMIQEMAM
ncbi:dihydrolipoyl dehydrogenase [Xylanibacter muris]|uniref:Dihydrolipoyl dehydrogenase n=1 Tax=Xylanibacter muris TaxID=2736290 RepID=A0ABX2ANU2_9BACT|nr:dihydrolipoyl dehydrogenase [Xylanibacter muris]NPD92623.1 dihydrolipoyl dehydrogenase [Xylanibacter muris]